MNSSLHRLANQIAHATEGIAPERLRWHPGGKWSIAEILEHLALTYSGSKIVFDRCLQSGKPSATVPSGKDRVRTFIVTRLGYLPSGREAPAGTRPKGIPCENIRSEIVQKIAAMDESIGECELRFGSGVKLVNHPILGPLSAAEWRRFHCVHGRHHLRQIRHLRKLMKSDSNVTQD
jgi:DinB superfamily